MIEDLVDVFDRSWEFLSREEGVNFALACFPFHEQLLRESRTALLLSDFRREERASRQMLLVADDAARASLSAIIDDLERDHPDAFPPAPADDDYDRSIDATRRRLVRAPVDPDDDAWGVGRETDDDGRLEHALRIVQGICQSVNRQDLQERTDQVDRELEHAKRVRRTYFRTGAGAALERHERDLADLHPPATDRGLNAWLARHSRLQRSIGHIYKVLFGKWTDIDDATERSIDSHLAVMRKDVERVYEEVRRRLGSERSLLAVFDRYRQRCQWYDADRLRTIAQRGRGKPEDRLTETLVTYLFDRGLNPLTRPLAGQLQPDLLGVDARFSFYVEAKQYEAANRTYLIDGMHQVWDMLGQLAGSGFDVAEAFYVIYRRKGPRYVFPNRVQHQDRVVHIMVIDLAVSKERGSNAPRTDVIELADLLPRAAPVTVARARPRRRRDGARRRRDGARRRRLAWH